MHRESTVQMGLVKCRNQQITNQIPVTTVSKKGHSDFLAEPVMQTFWNTTPYAYDIKGLRVKLHAVCAPIISGERKRVELSLERFPQVGTVMGEIVAQMPKAERLNFGYTTKEEGNTLFFIERA